MGHTRHVARPRLVKYHKALSFQNLEVATIGEASPYLRNPSSHVNQLQKTYDLVRSEKPRIHQLTSLSATAALGPNGGDQALKLPISYLFFWGPMLALEVVINNVLRSFNPDPAPLAAAQDCYYETLGLAEHCDCFRPYGSGFIPDALKPAWAITSDTHTDTAMETILKDYEKDVEGADYMSEALRLRCRLQRIRDHHQARARHGNSAESMEKEQAQTGIDGTSKAFCMILSNGIPIYVLTI